MSRIVKAYEEVIPAPLADQLNDILNRAVQIDGADFGDIQIYEDSTNVLHLLVQRGFDLTFEDEFREVRAFSGTSCGRAIGHGGIVAIPDVREDIGFNPYLHKINFLACKSVPVPGSSGEKLGVISTHFKLARPAFNLNHFNGLVGELVPLLSSIRRQVLLPTG